MNFIQFKSSLKDFPIFSLTDIRAVDPKFDRRRLSEWQNKEYISKVSKGLYIFNDFDVTEDILFRIANKLYRPSYISLESALSYYQLIPEITYGVTSVSTRRTYRFDTPVTHFAYRSIARHLFFGYVVIDNTTKLATLEKALLDFFYLNHTIDGPEAFASLRFDHEAFFEQMDEDSLNSKLRRFETVALTKRIRRFMEWIRNA